METTEGEILDALVSAAMDSNKKFAELLKAVMRRNGITVKELSEGSGVPVSTINKVLSGGRDLRLSTFRDVIRFVVSQKSDANGDITVGIIAARSSLNAFSKNTVALKGKKVLIKEYPVNSLEEAIISAIRAEREKVQGLVCASIVATTIEKFVRIPLVTIRIEESNIIDSLGILVDKILSSPKNHDEPF